MKTISICKIDGIWQAVRNDGSTVFASVYDNVAKQSVWLPISAASFELCQRILHNYLNGATSPFGLAMSEMAYSQEMQTEPIKFEPSENHLVIRSLRELLRQTTHQNAALIELLRGKHGISNDIIQVFSHELDSKDCETNVLLELLKES